MTHLKTLIKCQASNSLFFHLSQLPKSLVAWTPGKDSSSVSTKKSTKSCMLFSKLKILTLNSGPKSWWPSWLWDSICAWRLLGVKIHSLMSNDAARWTGHYLVSLWCSCCSWVRSGSSGIEKNRLLKLRLVLALSTVISAIAAISYFPFCWELCSVAGLVVHWVLVVVRFSTHWWSRSVCLHRSRHPPACSWSCSQLAPRRWCTLPTEVWISCSQSGWVRGARSASCWALPY